VDRKAFARYWLDAYLRVDRRSLGVGRIVLGLVLILDLLRRVPWLRDFYSNEGLLPNHTLLWRPPLPRMFSLMFMSSLPEESALWFLVCLFCFACFTLGYRTRVFHAISFVLMVSLHNRILFVENWGGTVLGLVLVWTFFLPLGARFSVDAVRKSLRAGEDELPPDLTAGIPRPDDTPVASLAVLCLLLQLAAIYWFNALHKTGPTWRDGTAVHYVLHQERIVTGLGLWARDHLSPSLWKAATKLTLVVERFAPLLLLTPIFWRWTRLVAVIVLTALHLGFAALVNLGIFSAAMLTFFPFLIDGQIWDRAARLVPMRGRTRTVFYDVDCGVCYALVRVLARLDVHRRLRLLPNTDTDQLPAGIDPALVDRTIVVLDEARGRHWTRAAAMAQILAALPFGRLWVWPLWLPGVRELAGRAYDLFARNRTRVSVWLGLAACGMPVAPGAGPAGNAEGGTPLGAWLRARLPLVRELAVAVVLVVMASEVSVGNPAVPRALRWASRPQWMADATMYTRLFQNWALFAPDAPTVDQTVVVDAVTKDGRHVDPYNQVGSRVAALPVTRVPERLGQDAFFCDYTLRIPDAHAYHQAFVEWMVRHPERTHRPEDAIVSFEARVVQQTSPAPGEREPRDVSSQLFLRWPAGGRP
jgi:predicted DCC family thiol-disulfide oxidoreductase YuxK